MPISSFSRVAKFSLVPLLFSAATLGVQFTYLSSRDHETALNDTVKRHGTEDPFSADTPPNPNLREIEIAARKGDIAARVELAKRYATGTGVPKNEARAFAYFKSIANQNTEVDPRLGQSQQISEVFRFLAHYYLRGLPEAHVEADANYAFSLLHYAASYFGDPASQFELAKLILKGEGINRNPRIAAQWLLNASRKGYPPAQALLGHLLWRGEGIKRVAGDGLGLLAVARSSASVEDRVWVNKLYNAALAEATLSDILEANAFIAQETSALRRKLTSEILISGIPMKAAGAAAGALTGGIAVGSSAGSYSFQIARARLRLHAGDGTTIATNGVERPSGLIAKASEAANLDSRFLDAQASLAGKIEEKAKSGAPMGYVPGPDEGLSSVSLPARQSLR